MRRSSIYRLRALSSPARLGREYAGICKCAQWRRCFGATGITFYSPALKDDMGAGYTTVPSTGWGVMIPQPVAEVREQTGNFRKWALVIAGLGVVGAGVFSWFLAGLLREA